VLEYCGDAPHDRKKEIESSRRELEPTFTSRVSVSVWNVCVVPRVNGRFAECPTDDEG
jgi:hypothetical protein